MAELDQRPIAALLLPALSSLLIVGMFLAYLVIRWHRERVLSSQGMVGQKAKQRSQHANAASLHLALKRPHCWLAVKNRNPVAVQNALALHDPKPCPLADGLAGENERKLFISPPLSGWILVVGSALPDPTDDVDACFRFILDVSRKLGHVQYFSASTMLNQHAWAQADGGHILRGYAWAGKTLWNQGAMTQAELDLHLKCYDYAEPPETPQFGETDSWSSNPDKVHLLAARWSVDPDDLDEQLVEQGWGIAGEPSRLY